MEIQIKKTIKSGNSSAVILPKSWLNEQVRVELVKESRLKGGDVAKGLAKRPYSFRYTHQAKNNLIIIWVMGFCE